VSRTACKAGPCDGSVLFGNPVVSHTRITHPRGIERSLRIAGQSRLLQEGAPSPDLCWPPQSHVRVSGTLHNTVLDENGFARRDVARGRVKEPLRITT
jgi:hypothetical protein